MAEVPIATTIFSYYLVQESFSLHQNRHHHLLFEWSLLQLQRKGNIFLLLLGIPSPNTRDDLSCCEIRSDCSNETNHCQSCVEDLCLRCESKFHCLFSCVLLIIMTRLPSWVNCNSSSGSHSSSSYKSSSFWISCQRASGLDICFTRGEGFSGTVLNNNECVLVIFTCSL